MDGLSIIRLFCVLLDIVLDLRELIRAREVPKEFTKTAEEKLPTALRPAQPRTWVVELQEHADFLPTLAARGSDYLPPNEDRSEDAQKQIVERLTDDVHDSPGAPDPSTPHSRGC